VGVKKKRPLRVRFALSNARFGRHAGAVVGRREEGRGHRQVAEVAAVARVAADERVDQVVREALGREDQPAVARQRQALGIEALGRIRLAVGSEERGHLPEVHVAVGELPVGHVEPDGVVARRLELARVVG
jgi:hypothetical protein